MSINELRPGEVAMVEVHVPDRDEIYTAAQHVLFVMDDDREVGMEPGSFMTLLIRAAAHADPVNISKMSLGFPAIATAVNIYKNVPGGVDMLRRLATKAPDANPGVGSPERKTDNE